eukprot:s505_g19.t2
MGQSLQAESYAGDWVPEPAGEDDSTGHVQKIRVSTNPDRVTFEVHSTRYHSLLCGDVGDGWSSAPDDAEALAADSEGKRFSGNLEWRHQWIAESGLLRTELHGPKVCEPEGPPSATTLRIERKLLSVDKMMVQLQIVDEEVKDVSQCTYCRTAATSGTGPSPVSFLREHGRPLKTLEDRLAVLDKVGKLVADSCEEISQAQATDRVVPDKFHGSAKMILGGIAFYKSLLPEWVKPEPVEDLVPVPLKAGVEAEWAIYNEPKGVCINITPWNAPATITLANAVSMLAAGNHVVIKPPELVPTISAVLRRLCQRYLSGYVWVEEGGKEVVERLIDEGATVLCFALRHSRRCNRASPRLGALVGHWQILHVGLCPQNLPQGPGTIKRTCAPHRQIRACPPQQKDLFQKANRSSIQTGEGHMDHTISRARHLSKACEGADHVSFTGGGEIAKLVAARCGQMLTPMTLELGGKSPAFVDAGLDEGMLRSIVQEILETKVFKTGQFCCAHDYVLIHESVLSAFCRVFKVMVEGLGAKRNVRMLGRKQYNSMTRLFQDCQAECIPPVSDEHGFNNEAMSVPMTGILAPARDRAVLQQEIFGPLLPILPVRDVQEAICIINAVATKPLIAYCYTQDRQVEAEFINNVPAGNIAVNGGPMRMISNYAANFGGTGPSGMGAGFWGRDGLKEFSNRKHVMCGRNGFARSFFSGPPNPA